MAGNPTRCSDSGYEKNVRGIFQQDGGPHSAVASKKRGEGEIVELFQETRLRFTLSFSFVGVLTEASLLQLAYEPMSCMNFTYSAVLVARGLQMSSKSG